jgi:hypothetical protein
VGGLDLLVGIRRESESARHERRGAGCELVVDARAPRVRVDQVRVLWQGAVQMVSSASMSSRMSEWTLTAVADTSRRDGWLADWLAGWLAGCIRAVLD